MIQGKDGVLFRNISLCIKKGVDLISIYCYTFIRTDVQKEYRAVIDLVLFAHWFCSNTDQWAFFMKGRKI